MGEGLCDFSVIFLPTALGQVFRGIPKKDSAVRWRGQPCRSFVP